MPAEDLRNQDIFCRASQLCVGDQFLLLSGDPDVMCRVHAVNDNHIIYRSSKYRRSPLFTVAKAVAVQLLARKKRTKPAGSIISISDWWDRSPCDWICNIDKLDEADPVQAAYKRCVQLALTTAERRRHGVHMWYFTGTAATMDLGEADRDAIGSGRPENVEHAAVLPPCRIDHHVRIYYS